MAIIKYNPFKMMSDRLIDDDFFSPFFNQIRCSVPVDIYEKKGKVHIDMELPGMSKENISIELDGDVLQIKGTIERDSEIKDEQYFRRERSVGEFSRAFTIPKNISEDDVSAEFDKGILKITFPKVKESEIKKRIPIL